MYSYMLILCPFIIFIIIYIFFVVQHSSQTITNLFSQKEENHTTFFLSHYYLGILSKVSQLIRGNFFLVHPKIREEPLGHVS